MYDEILDELKNYMEENEITLTAKQMGQIVDTIYGELEDVMYDKIQQYQQYLD